MVTVQALQHENLALKYNLCDNEMPTFLGPLGNTPLWDCWQNSPIYREALPFSQPLLALSHLFISVMVIPCLQADCERQCSHSKAAAAVFNISQHNLQTDLNLKTHLKWKGNTKPNKKRFWTTKAEHLNMFVILKDQYLNEKLGCKLI